MGARAISVQIQKLLLDLIFHIASRTVKLFIALAGREAFRRIGLETFLGRLVTMKRGLFFSWSTSALPMTRRARLQLSRV